VNQRFNILVSGSMSNGPWQLDLYNLGGTMTSISMEINDAKEKLGLLGDAINNLEESKKKLEALTISINDQWKSGSETEFKTLHDAKMYVFWTDIEELKNIRDNLASAINTYEITQEHLSSGGG
jgi:hypothetical protein